VLVDADREERVPAFAVDVVDTTGCGEAFAAGSCVGWRTAGAVGRRRARLRRAALVAQGLGSDHGDFDLAAADAFAAAQV
jgi:sugar/nucleoside kinase (ribokinase family)